MSASGTDEIEECGHKNHRSTKVITCLGCEEGNRAALAEARAKVEAMREALQRVRVVLVSVLPDNEMLGRWSKKTVLGWVDDALSPAPLQGEAASEPRKKI